MLAAKGRSAVTVAPSQWGQALFETGLIELPVNGDIGIQATELAGLHPDPADRVICATALHAGATLVTSNTTLWAGMCRCSGWMRGVRRRWLEPVLA